MSSVDLPRCRLEQQPHGPLMAAMLVWVSRVGPFWAASLAGHLAIFVLLALVLGTVHVTRTLIERVPPLMVVDTVLPESVPLVPLMVNETPLTPVPLEPPVPTIDDAVAAIEPIPEKPTLEPVDTRGIIADPYSRLAGSNLSNRSNLTALVDSRGSDREFGPGILVDDGLPRGPGSIGGRADRFINGTGNDGHTKWTKSAVIGALEWFMRHQARDGGWSLAEYTRQCKDTTCTGAGKIKSDSAATSFAVLPFLAAGFTHQMQSDYRKTIYGGLFWLVKQQGADGNLAVGSPSLMYSQGLATIALCEAFALSKDKQIGASAQAAIKFIEAAQNKDDGGWRYTPGQPGDTSVTGWQLMALKSGEMAGLKVDPEAIRLGKKYLKLASGRSKQGGLFGYMPDSSPTPSMTAVGLICMQYLGAKRDDPALAEGQSYLMKLLPDIHRRNSYYWYYGTLVMHNTPGADWDKWNFAVRRALVDSQVKNGCARGSWDPQKPAADSGSEAGGRVMATSLAALTLEVYYRYSPLYTLDKKDLVRRPEAK